MSRITRESPPHQAGVPTHRQICTDSPARHISRKALKNLSKYHICTMNKISLHKHKMFHAVFTFMGFDKGVWQVVLFSINFSGSIALRKRDICFKNSIFLWWFLISDICILTLSNYHLLVRIGCLRLKKSSGGLTTIGLFHSITIVITKNQSKS